MGKGDPRGGRPTKLTDEVAAGIIAAVRRGHTFQTACELHGLHHETMRLWRVQGERDTAEGQDTPESRFFGAFAQARAEKLDEDMAVLDGAVEPYSVDDKGHPTFLPESALGARKFLMAARFPNIYGKARMEHSGPDGGPMVTAQVTPEDAARALADILARKTSQE